MKTTLLLLCICYFTNSSAQLPPVKPGWPTAKPEECGLSSTELKGLFEYVKLHKTRVHSVQVLRQGKLVLDAYFYPYNTGWRHDVASVTKSITSTLVGIAIDNGHIDGISSKFYQYFPQYPLTDSLKKQITLEDLITMRSGLDCGTNMADPGINYDRRLEQVRNCPDWLRCILDIPVVRKPGESFAYCNVNCQLLSAIIQKTSGVNASGFADRHLFGPLGIHAYWPADPQGVSHGWGDLQLHPYDMLRIGQLMLQNGKWKGRQLISESWLKQATATHVTTTGNNDQYGYYWWIPGPAYPGVFEAVGRGGQRITIWPSQQTVIVFTGGGFNTSELVPFIINAMKSDRPLPANAAAYTQLQSYVRSAAVPSPVAASLSATTPTAGISGKIYKMEQNALAWDTIGLTVRNNREADLYLKWAGRDVKCTVGLDGAMRFSHNPITRLTQGCTGTWINAHTLRVQLDLIGAINLYNFDLVFADDAATVQVTIREETGLNDTKFTGTVIQ